MLTDWKGPIQKAGEKLAELAVALNLGWKEQEIPVSYTHLDVYKRQELYLNNGEVAAIGEMVYVKMTPERITDVPLTEELYHLTPDAEPLEFVELYGDDPANVPFKVEKK